MANKAAKKPANIIRKTRLVDRGEPVSAMEPMLISEGSRHRALLHERVFELAAATALKTSLPEGIMHALSDLVRSMNCYYSNLIEGHNTHPVDIERALAEDFSADQRQRALQLEAKAHIATRRWIDEDGLAEHGTTAAAVAEIHRRFASALPPDLLVVACSPELTPN
jgi:hypothetical protein